ncbi:MFS transporter [Thermostaphylospora chromogena]|uniref:MFS transporter, DHA2 family, multidrug resistance protein n=1 Tax=Thermostaphylospora chromogena TaxID=35622 RepID=A0A1H0ZT78_9ACTN|nr:MFS transporter [Thermostaphylospora chromogena]SDQ30644.1 MFS transporter, DHA2 family, multidrug resistance protein [Thermostaphylospora chromogena]
MDAGTEAGSGVRAGRREWLGLAVLALPTLLLSIDLTVLYLALPHLSAELAPSSTQQLWILDIYGFLIAGFLITMGNLGDRIGRRRLLMIGAAAFGVASAFAAYATSPETLIAARAVMGVAGATLMPSTLALISNMFKDPKQMGVAIGIWMGCFMAGSAVGPLFGGALLTSFWWGSVFLVNLPIMLLLLLVAPKLLPEYRNPEAGRPDLTSVALSLVAILTFIYAIKELPKTGWEPVTALALVVGLAVGTAFVLRQRRLADPLLDMGLFGSRSFSAALLSMLFGFMAVSAIGMFVVQYLQTVEGLNPLMTGLWSLPGAGVTIIGTVVAPVVARRVRPAYLISGGLVLSLIGLVLMSQITSGVPPMIGAQALVMFGMSPLMAVGYNMVIGSAPMEKAGSAASMSETTGEVAGALGIAVLGTVGTATYTTRMADAVPAGFPAEAAEAARETLAGAVAVAEQVPQAAATLVASAREAFIEGMHATAIVSAVLIAIVIVFVLTMLRHIDPIGAEESGEAAAAEQADGAAPADAVVPAGEVGKEEVNASASR